VLELKEIPVAPRRTGEKPNRAIQKEGADMLAALGADDYVVALDITAKAMSTEQLSLWLAERMRDGRPLALLIGGPDGLAPQCRERADRGWSLSPLTLPHGLVRVVVAEQLYRAVSLLAGHPYHRA
jgi:23S rRNA (pseudouridine1915-N3)-methyltransferase